VAPNSADFFHTRPGLWVSNDFRNLVLTKADENATGDVPHKSIIIDEDMNDKDIEKMLGDNHYFSETQVCLLVKKQIEAQWGGKSGFLLNDGKANIYYTGSCVVNVNWDAGVREWNVHTWNRDVVRWNAGHQVFSPATDAS